MNLLNIYKENQIFLFFFVLQGIPHIITNSLNIYEFSPFFCSTALAFIATAYNHCI